MKKYEKPSEQSLNKIFDMLFCGAVIILFVLFLISMFVYYPIQSISTVGGGIGLGFLAVGLKNFFYWWGNRIDIKEGRGPKGKQAQVVEEILSAKGPPPDED